MYDRMVTQMILDSVETCRLIMRLASLVDAACCATRSTLIVQLQFFEQQVVNRFRPTMLAPSFHRVPVGMWIRIFHFLDIPDILQIRRVCGATPFVCFGLKYKSFTGLLLFEQSQPLQRHMDRSLSQCQLFSTSQSFPLAVRARLGGRPRP